MIFCSIASPYGCFTNRIAPRKAMPRTLAIVASYWQGNARAASTLGLAAPELLPPWLAVPWPAELLLAPPLPLEFSLGPAQASELRGEPDDEEGLHGER